MTTSSPPLSLTQVWKATLSELQLQMTRATFDTWLRNATFLRADDTTIVISLQSDRAVDWVENRLKDTISRTINAITGKEWNLAFEIAEAAAPPSSPTPEYPDTSEDQVQAQPRAGQAHITLFEVDPTRGFISVPHYALRFWRPLLGLVPFTLWEVLRSYGYFVSQGKGEWPTIEMIADTLGQGSRATILGRAASGDRPAQDGAVQVLTSNRLITHWVRGDGRQTVHYFRVLDSLPVLAPVQVAQLSPRKQKEHDEFLKYFKGFNLEAWASIKAQTLIGNNWWE